MKKTDFFLLFAVCILLICCFPCAVVCAAQWVLFGESEGQSRYFYDAGRITGTSSGTILVWTKVVFSEPDKEEIRRKMTARGQPVKGYENMSHDLDLFELNCSTRANRYVSTTTYDRSGKILYTYEFTGKDMDWEPVVKGGLKESLLKMACRTAKKQSQQ